MSESSGISLPTPQQVMGKHAADAQREAATLARRVKNALSRPPRDGHGWPVNTRGYSQAAVNIVVAALRKEHWRVEPCTVEGWELVQAGREAFVPSPAIYIQPGVPGATTPQS